MSSLVVALALLLSITRRAQVLVYIPERIDAVFDTRLIREERGLSSLACHAGSFFEERGLPCLCSRRCHAETSINLVVFDFGGCSSRRSASRRMRESSLSRTCVALSTSYPLNCVWHPPFGRCLFLRSLT